MNGKFEDMTGRRFGRLVIINELHHGKVECRCDCGNEVVVTKAYLINGNTMSCGCICAKRSAESLSQTSSHGGAAYIKRLSSGTTNTKNTSGVRGVWWDKKRSLWVAEIKYDGKKHFLGRFAEKEDAILARGEAEEQYFAPAIEEYSKQSIDKSLIGQKFHRWTVLDVRESKRNKQECLCRCKCGAERWVRLSALTSGLSKSCGCLRHEPKK